jgi:hypothetical protein
VNRIRGENIIRYVLRIETGLKLSCTCQAPSIEAPNGEFKPAGYTLGRNDFIAISTPCNCRSRPGKRTIITRPPSFLRTNGRPDPHGIDHLKDLRRFKSSHNDPVNAMNRQQPIAGSPLPELYTTSLLHTGNPNGPRRTRPNIRHIEERLTPLVGYEPVAARRQRRMNNVLWGE